MRTWTNEDGVYVHVGDLIASIERVSASSEVRGAKQDLGMKVVATALADLERRALRDAIAQTAFGDNSLLGRLSRFL